MDLHTPSGIGDTARPFFSVVTITLNNLAGLRKTRASVEEQTLRDFEWIVVDGASTDGTVEELQNCELPNLSWSSEKDSGLYNAMNKGLARVRGRYAIFMNAGDCFASSDVMERARVVIAASGGIPQMVFGDAIERTEDGIRLYKKARSVDRLHYGMHTNHQAMFYSSDALDGLRFNESFRIAADYDLTCRVYMRGGGSLALDFPICIFAHGGVSEKIAHVGRSENWRVQRDVLGHSLHRRLTTRARYLASFTLRTRFQPLYNRLRYEYEHPTR